MKTANNFKSINYVESTDRNRCNELMFHQSISTFFMSVIYIPYMVILTLFYDIFDLSLSRIGWQNDGFLFLLGYELLSIPFLYYLIPTNMKYRNNRNKIVSVTSMTGLALLIGGGLIPYRLTDSQFVLNLHRFCGAAGSILLIFVVTYLVVKCNMRPERKSWEVVTSATAYLKSVLLFHSLSFCNYSIAHFLETQFLIIQMK